MTSRCDEKADSGQVEMALSNTYKQHLNEATLDSTTLEKQGAKDAGAQKEQHEPPTLTEEIATGDTPGQAQQDVSTATTLDGGPPLQQWNHPRINVGRSMVAFYGLVIMGANDAAYGVS